MKGNSMQLLFSSAGIVSIIAAGWLAFQLNMDGYYLGWSSGIIEACSDGCPGLSREDLGLASTLAPEDSQFRQNTSAKWFGFIGCLAVAAVAAVASLLSLLVGIKAGKGR